LLQILTTFYAYYIICEDSLYRKFLHFVAFPYPYTVFQKSIMPSAKALAISS